MRAPPTLGPLLRDARRQLGARQEGLAATIGVSARTILGWERHGVMPTPSQRERVVAAFAAIDHDPWCKIVAALGLPLEAMLAKVPRQRAVAQAKTPTEAEPRRAARGALDDAIRVQAEMLDVTARRLPHGSRRDPHRHRAPRRHPRRRARPRPRLSAKYVGAVEPSLTPL